MHNPEREALLAAVLTSPDDDLPRLVFADWLDDNGDPEGARFIRSQIALATLPEWDPQAVALRRTQAEWDVKAPHIDPDQSDSVNRGTYWYRKSEFRRGFPHFIRATALPILQSAMPALLGEVPIARLGLHSATLDQWKEFAASPWLPRIREIDFEGIGAAIEGMRELCRAPGASGLRALRFRSCTSAAMPEVLDRLWRCSLGDGMETLELANAFGSDESYFEDFLEAFHVGGERLKSLRLQSMGFGGSNLHRFLTSRSWTNLETLSLFDEIGQTSTEYLNYPDCWPALRSIHFDTIGVNFRHPHLFANSLRAPNLTVLDIRKSLLRPEAVQSLAKADHLAKLRVLRLVGMGIDNRSVRYLSGGKFWKNLVELDLRRNPIDENGAKFLLKRQPPPGLELLRMENNFPEAVGEALQEHFNGRVALHSRNEIV